MTMKTCSTCCTEKPLDEFYRNSRAKDGRDSRCTSCEKLRLAKWAADNPERIREAQRRYEATGKGNGRSQRWAKENPERYAQIQADYHKRHPCAAKEASRKRYHSDLDRARKDVLNRKAVRRTRLVNNGVFRVTTEEVTKILSHPCAVCGSKQNPTLDHIIPVSRGGPHSIGNLQCLCASCNYSKRDALPIEFRMRRLKTLTLTDAMTHPLTTATNHAWRMVP